MTHRTTAPSPSVSTGDLLQVDGLRAYFHARSGPLKAVDGISYSVAEGEALAIVGESGSGKSIGVRTLLGLLPSGGYVAGGTARYGGLDLLTCGEKRLQKVRGKEIGMIFQDALQSMNPTLTLKQQLTEHQLRHRLCSKTEAVDRAVEMLGKVGIPQPERRIEMYPFQLSGGLRQRAMIAMAMVTQPRLLIADEPTTAVDVTLQRQILELLRQIKSEGTAMIMITHDLGVARFLCDRVAVMYGGRIIESAPTEELLTSAQHPYTRGLLSSTIEVGDAERALTPIPGTPPSLHTVPQGCAFAPRCTLAEDPCHTDQELLTVSAGHQAACWKVPTRV